MKPKALGMTMITHLVATQQWHAVPMMLSLSQTEGCWYCAECHPGRAGLRRKQPLAVALENVRRLRLHGVASRPGAWQGCIKNSE